MTEVAGLAVTKNITVCYYHVRQASQSKSTLGRNECVTSDKCHLSFRYRFCFEQEIPWHSGNYTVQIHSEMRTGHDNNIQSNALYRYVLTTQINQTKAL